MPIREWEVVISSNMIWGGIFVILAAYCSRLAAVNWRVWGEMWQQTPKSFDEGPPPIVTVQQGLIGCLGGIWNNFWVIIFSLLALDQFLTAGAGWLYIFDVLQQLLMG